MSCQRDIQFVAIEMFKVLRGLEPEIMKNLFSIDRISESRSFFRPNVNSEYDGENSIWHFGSVIWDSMFLDKLKSIQTLEKFKIEVKNGFLLISHVLCARGVVLLTLWNNF